MATDEALALLKSIDDRIRELNETMSSLLAQRRASAPKAAADDRDLDGKYGDPVIRFKKMPRDWTGASYTGRHFSECPPDLLDLLADQYEWLATQADKKQEKTTSGKPVSFYSLADAKRCRGWAKRIRDGKHTPPQEPDYGGPEFASGADEADEAEVEL